MNFVFVCPQTHQTFESQDFEITEYRGVHRDHDGHKILDAEIELTTPCPFCHKLHRYNAQDLICPFNPPAENDNPIDKGPG